MSIQTLRARLILPSGEPFEFLRSNLLSSDVQNKLRPYHLSLCQCICTKERNLQVRLVRARENSDALLPVALKDQRHLHAPSCGTVGLGESTHSATFHTMAESSFSQSYAHFFENAETGFVSNFLEAIRTKYKPHHDHEIVLAYCPVTPEVIPIDQEIVDLRVEEITGNGIKSTTWTVAAGTDFGGRTDAHGHEIKSDYFICALRQSASKEISSIHAWPIMLKSSHATFHSYDEIDFLSLLDSLGIRYFKPPTQTSSTFLADSGLKETLKKLEDQKIWVDVVIAGERPHVVEIVSLDSDEDYDLRWCIKQNILTELSVNDRSFGFLAVTPVGSRWRKIAGEIPSQLKSHIQDVD